MVDKKILFIYTHTQVEQSGGKWSTLNLKNFVLLVSGILSAFAELLSSSASADVRPLQAS